MYFFGGYAKNPSMENTSVFGYVRVSTAGQVKEGFSLEQQKEEIVKFQVFARDEQWNRKLRLSR